MTAPVRLPPDPAPELPRKAFDEYPTPYPVALACLRELVATGALSEGMHVLEPCCGHDNHWITALRVIEIELEWVPFIITACDIQDTAVLAAARDREVPDVPGALVRGADYYVSGDFLDLAYTRFAPGRRGRRFDLAVGNPPYAVVEPGKRKGQWVVDQHVNAARHVARWVGFLLQQQTFTSSKAPERVEWATADETRPWWRREAVPRISFEAGSTRCAPWDSTFAAWGPCRSPSPDVPSQFLRWRLTGRSRIGATA